VLLSLRPDFAVESYLKTAVASLMLVAAGSLLALIGLYRLSGVVGPVVAALSLLATLGAATLFCASVLVLLRHRRGMLGERDLFLELNRSREPGAIGAATVAGPANMRRWLARSVLGHDFVVGDLVEIRTWEEIRSTLDEQGCLDGLPFMPEMLAMCGRRAYVFRCMHRLFDYRKTRRMRHMEGAVLLVGAVCDGLGHGACEAACHTIWKSAWLRRVGRNDVMTGARALTDRSDPIEDLVLRSGTQAPRHVCQLTQLNAASRPVRSWSAANFLRPLIAGNVAPTAFIAGWLTYLFNEVQHYRQGVGFPAFEAAIKGGGGIEEAGLNAADRVVVRSSAEIRATLNDRLEHRGLWFESDMLKHCGRRCCVQAEVKNLIDIVTGELRAMKTPAYILSDVHFSGERQLFNAQYEPLFWRGVWLRREDGPPAPRDTNTSVASREASR